MESPTRPIGSRTASPVRKSLTNISSSALDTPPESSPNSITIPKKAGNPFT